MITDRKCAICSGAIHSHRRSDTVYCSTRCVRLASQSRARQRRRDKPRNCSRCGRDIRLTRAHHLCRICAVTHKTTYTLTCGQCQREFTSFHKEQLHCSRKCLAESQKRTLTCQVCGIEYVGTVNGNGVINKYCSANCNATASYWKTTKRHSKTCEGCGKQFNGAATHRFCSYACSNRVAASTYWKQRIDSECPRCGKTFTGKPRQKFCSAQCNGLTQADTRRARKRGAFVATVYPHEIYERDKGTCQLCHEPVDIEVKWPDEKSLSLDHVIPLARGGKHCPENVQLAHLGCNNHKRASEPESIPFLPATRGRTCKGCCLVFIPASPWQWRCDGCRARVKTS